MRDENRGKGRSINSLLQSIDLYGSMPDFLYRGQTQFKSSYGGCVSLLAVVMYSLCISLNVWRYYERSSPETNINKLFVKDPRGFNASRSTLPFAFGMQGPDAVHFVDPTYFKPRVMYRRQTKSMVNGQLVATMKVTDLTLISCSGATLDRQFFNNLDLANMFCIKEFEDPNFGVEVTGVFEGNVYGTLRIQISPCIGAGCKTQAEIEAKMKSSYFAINYIGTAIKSSNYSDPIEKFPTSFFTTTSTMYTKEVQMRMADNQIDTQASPFGYVTPETVNFTGVSYLAVDYSKFADPGQIVDKFLTVNIRMLQEKIHTNRAYKTVFQYLAELGGVFNVITLVTVMFTLRVGKTLMMVDLAKFSKLKTSLFGPYKTSTPGQEPPLGKAKLAKSSSSMLGILVNPSPKSSPLTSDPKSSSVIASTGVKKRSHVFVKESPKKKPSISFKSFTENEPLGLSLQMKEVEEKKANNTPIRKSEEEEQDFVFESPEKKKTLRETEGGAKGTSQTSEEIIRASFFNFHDPNHQEEIPERDLRGSKPGSVLLQSFLPCLLRKRTAIKKIVEYSSQTSCIKLDYLRVVDLINDLQKLKALLLTPDQHTLFDLLPPPASTDASADLLERIIGGDETEVLKYKKKAVESYENICKLPVLDKVDQKLLFQLGYLLEGYRIKSPA